MKPGRALQGLGRHGLAGPGPAGRLCRRRPRLRAPGRRGPGALAAEAGWQAGQPRDDELKGPWWQLYADPGLQAWSTRP
jgi:hypothetical protein